MATKTANVMARVEPQIKEQAEKIMEMLGIPSSTSRMRNLSFSTRIPVPPLRFLHDIMDASIYKSFI